MCTKSTEPYLAALYQYSDCDGFVDDDDDDDDVDTYDDDDFYSFPAFHVIHGRILSIVKMQ